MSKGAISSNPASGVRGASLPRLPLAIGVALWILALVLGLRVEWRYAATPATDGAKTSSAWPVASKLPRAPGKQTLILFAHPKCPCTRATLAELEKILPRSEQPVDFIVDFVQPRGEPAAFLSGGNWERAKALPGAQVVADANGSEASLFAATASGTLALYSPGGALLFSGGITALRGHAGDNTGEERLKDALAGRVPDARTFPVFGCALGGDAIPDSGK